MIRSLLIIVLVLLAGYGLIEAWPLIIGPSLSVAVPKENGTFPGDIVTVSGRAQRVAILTLDGAPLLHDENGNFNATLTFPAGTSLLTMSATDRFGRRVTVTRDIFIPD